MERRQEDRLMEVIIGAAYEVSNTLGVGFLEKLYERALALELKQRAINVVAQAPLEVRYKGVIIGAYYADLVVENRLIVELKCVEKIVGQHIAQCINYLRACDMQVALLLNFQHPGVELKKVVLN